MGWSSLNGKGQFWDECGDFLRGCVKVREPSELQFGAVSRVAPCIGALDRGAHALRFWVFSCHSKQQCMFTRINASKISHSAAGCRFSRCGYKRNIYDYECQSNVLRPTG